jgi:RHS repeat-associated protein
MRRYLLLVLAVLSLPLGTRSQTGLPAFGSFQSSGFDVVNQQNLNAVFAIPISSIPGRGQGFQYSLVNNSLLWAQTGGTPNAWTPVTDASGNPSWGWSYGPAVAGSGQILYQWQGSNHLCRYVDPNTGLYVYASWSFHSFSNFRYKDWLGSVHPFNLGYSVITASPDAQTYCGIQNSTTGPVSGYATDNTGFFLYASQGPTYVLSPAGVNAGAAPVDTNGNYVSQTVVNSTETDWTDTAGHLALKVFKNSSNTQYEWQDSSGNYTSATTTTVQFSTLNIKTNFACSSITEYTGTASLPTEIDLPNGQKYLITYEPTPGFPGYYTGRVQRVTFPTGGYYEYDYPVGANDGIVCGDASVNSLTRVTNDGTNTPTWTFSRIPSGSNWVTTVTAPQLPYDTAANNSVYTFNSSGQQITAQFYQGSVNSANLKRTVSTSWSGGAPATQIAVLEDGTTQNEVETSYDSYGNLLTLKEHDWGTGAPGSVLRTTTWTYLNSSPYISANILNRPTRVTIADSGGTVRGRTDVAYDESGYINSTCITGAPQHNDSNFGCTFTTRGDPTTVTTYTNPSGGTGPVTSHNYYDDLGNLTKVTDPNNNPTAYSYASTFGYAYPTTVTNALNQSNTYNYNSYTGRLMSSTDPNNQQTTYTYDAMLRLSQINSPDGGQTVWTYTSATSTTATTKMNSSQNIVTSALLDGLGRSKENQLNSDPEGVVYQDTSYDPLGRIYTASNPYRTTSDPTYGITTYRYDTLGRTTSVILQDGSVSTATYATNTTTVTDPAGKKRQSAIDGLGRLIQMTEDPGGLGYVTSYTYDALNNAMSVVENASRQRSFTYDALSRLVCEGNPEIQIATCPYPDNGSYTTGTIRYAYDNNSNLTSRIAPAPNQTGSATVTTTYTNDSLNRPTQKSYSDGTTRTVFFAYDQTNTWGNSLSNTIGRLTEQWNGQSCCATAGAEIFSYDPMGRVVLNTQYTPAMSYRPMSYTYDLAGNMSTFTDGVGETYTQTLDPAGRVTQLNSSWVDSQHPAVLAATDSSIGYYPFGALRKMNLGNNLTQTYAFNKDLQPCRINANSSASVLGTCADAIPSGNLQDFNYGFNLGSSDNGNVMTWTGTGRQSFNRTYGYDSLNRLSTLSSPSDPNGCTGLSWTIDSWGNRTDQTVTGGSCRGFHQAINAQNRLANSPYQYDAAGNLIADGIHTYTYDAENLLISVDSGATATYLYDATGRRVQKAVASGQTQYIYDLSGNVASELDQNLNWKNAYVRMNGALFAQYTVGSPRTTFILADHLGSARLLTDMNQSVVQNLDYLPFGELNSSDSGISTHEFTGDEQDAETALAHTWFRQYSSSMGRWMTPDPAGLAAVDPTNPQSWNRYAYVIGDPIDLIDPWGLCSPGAICVTAWGYGGGGGYGNPWPTTGSMFGGGAPGDINSEAEIYARNHGGGGGTSSAASSANGCVNGWGSGGIGVGAGGNLDLGAALAGASATGGVGGGIFHNKAGGLTSGWSAGGFADGGAAAYAGSHVVGAPTQSAKTVFSLGAYAGVGPNVNFTNGASSQQLKGPFTTVSINVGIGIANLGVQFSFGGGIWQFSVTPPVVSVGIGAAGSVVTTNTVATNTGCHN